MLRLLAAASLLALSAGGLPFAALAQEAAAPSSFQSQVVTLNQQRLFEESEFGKSSLLRLESDARSLQGEIRKIESDLEIEERLLTERRATMPPAEFQPLAQAFDDKVEKIRAAWAAKDRDLKRQRDEDQQKFFDSAVPILAELMQELGAVLLVDQTTVILSLDKVDITQAAIERINARLAKIPASGEIQSDPAPTPAPDTPAESTVQKP